MIEIIVRYYSASFLSIIAWMKSWGWIYGIWGYVPYFIPIVPLTTDFSIMIGTRLALTLIIFYTSLVISNSLKKPMIFFVVILMAALAFCSCIEIERQSLNEFQTLTELSHFLATDNTNRLLYSGEYNCEDFSRALIRNAKNKGYIIYYHTIPNHAMCKTYIVSEDIWVLIEPQTDKITRVD